MLALDGVRRWFTCSMVHVSYCMYYVRSGREFTRTPSPTLCVSVRVAGCVFGDIQRVHHLLATRKPQIARGGASASPKAARRRRDMVHCGKGAPLALWR